MDAARPCNEPCEGRPCKRMICKRFHCEPSKAMNRLGFIPRSGCQHPEGKCIFEHRCWTCGTKCHSLYEHSKVPPPPSQSSRTEIP